MTSWKGKRILITGVCGTVGQELLRQLVQHEPESVVGIDNNETELFFLSERYSGNSMVNLSLGDVRDYSVLNRKMAGSDIVLHTAALKHVILSEQSPREAVQTNVLGTQNVIDAAKANGVERVLFTSSDKAVNPTSVMGTSKLMGERLMTAAHATDQRDGPIYASTRFGNVLGSRGSVLPLFRRQIKLGGPVTLTHADMTRFVMTLEEAVRLVMESVFLACGGEVFVTKMPVVRIADVARVMIDELAHLSGFEPGQIRIKMIGTKPGEKLYEELMNVEEARHSLELERYFIVVPAFKSIYKEVSYEYDGVVAGRVSVPYNSANAEAMTADNFREYLYRHGLLERVQAHVPSWRLSPISARPAVA